MSAWGHKACYKIKCCSIICRLNKINSVSFVYYSLLVSCFHDIHFTETIHLCEGVEPLLAVRCMWESSKIGKSGYLNVLIEGKRRRYMAMCGFMLLLFKEGVIYKCLYPPSLTRICLSSHAFRISSAGYFIDYQCTGYK